MPPDGQINDLENLRLEESFTFIVSGTYEHISEKIRRIHHIRMKSVSSFLFALSLSTGLLTFVEIFWFSFILMFISLSMIYMLKIMFFEEEYSLFLLKPWVPITVTKKEIIKYLFLLMERSHEEMLQVEKNKRESDAVEILSLVWYTVTLNRFRQ